MRSLVLILCRFLGLGLLAAHLPAADAGATTLVPVNSVRASAAARTAQAEVDGLHRRINELAGDGAAALGRTAVARELETLRQKLRGVGERFFRDQPTDPLRWEILLHLLLEPPDFVTGFAAGLDEEPDEGKVWDYYVIDEPARAAWEAKLAQLDQAMQSAGDVPWEVREQRGYLELRGALVEAQAGEPAAARAVEVRIDALAKEFPRGLAALGAYLELYAPVLAAGEEAAGEIWRRLAASPNAAVAVRARREVQSFDLRRQPVELKFSALDGRAFDLARWRGKVVLVDFWATWHAPSVAELANRKRVWQAYRDRGFEVVGITVENARLSASDFPEQAAAKKEEARQKVAEVVREQGLAWPQYFDGEYWRNAVAKQFGVVDLPAGFLLDREGRLASTNVRGANLEAELRRLLEP